MSDINSVALFEHILKHLSGEMLLLFFRFIDGSFPACLALGLCTQTPLRLEV